MDPDDEADGADDGEVGMPPAANPVLIAFTLIDLALNPKAAKAGLKQLVKLNKDIGIAEAKLAAVTAQVEQKQAALAERESAIAAHESALEKRESELASSLEDAHRELYAHHNSVAQAHRQLAYRVMSTAGILGNWNFDLQGPPSWEQLKRMVAGLPDDLPSPAPHAVTREVTTDWTGNHSFIAGSSLTRTVSP
jgi:hypothetical protein